MDAAPPRDVDTAYTQGLALWSRAERVAALLAIDNPGLGGAWILGGHGTASETWLRQLGGLFASAASPVVLPAHCADEALIGSIALDRSLATGTLVAEPGLLTRANGGVLVARMAETMDVARAAIIAAAMDRGEVQVERTGLSRADPARFALILADSGRETDPTPPPALVDRLAFKLPLDQIPQRCCHPFLVEGADLVEARSRLPLVTISDAYRDALIHAADALGVQATRAALFTLRTARAIAALNGEATVSDTALQEAAGLVLAHRATQLPTPDETPDEPPPPPPENTDAPEDRRDEADPDQTDPPSALEDLLVDAVQSAALAAALEQLGAPAASKAHTASKAGRAGAKARRQSNGRPDRAVPRHRMRAGRIDLVATLRAAAPYQPLRRAKSPSGPAPGPRLSMRGSDLRVKTYRHRTGTSVIFIVDASGSSALNRMGEAKGAIEHLLADCYSRRDHVALIAARGAQAECLLPPTRALTRVRRALSALPSGGTTPLASALLEAGRLAELESQAGRTPFLVMLSDGRGNVALDGSTDRDAAAEDLEQATRRLARLALPMIVFDTARRPGARARTLAEGLRADYRPLPHAAADAISSTVRTAIGRR